MTDQNGFRLRDFLPQKLDGIGSAVKEDLQKDPAMKGAALAWGFVGEKAGNAILGTLDIDVFEVLARSWCKVRELYKYTDPGKYAPDKTWIVHLGKHETPTISVHPVVQTGFGLLSGPKLHFTVEVTATFDSVALSIRNGHIVGVGAGDGFVGAQLKYREVNLHKKLESKKVVLSKELKFKDPGFSIAPIARQSQDKAGVN